MPFMIGPAPIRRTLKYLNAGKLFLKDEIKIVTLHYNTGGGEPHHGARDFGFWYIPQIQYKNPNVQIMTMKNMTPSPFIRCYYEGGQQMLIDVDGKSKEDILAHLTKIIGKSEAVIAKETQQKEIKDNPANFGYGCVKACICEIPHQVPCPGIIPLPKNMRGKYLYSKQD